MNSELWRRCAKTVLLGVALFAAAVAVATPLDDAREAGLVTETPDGYVVAEEGAPKKVQQLVEDVNSRRREAYARIAAQTGATVEQVGRESYVKRHQPE